MTAGRSSRRKQRPFTGPFSGLPHDVLDCAAYLRLPHPARSLLLEFARQYSGHNNGRLLSSLRHLKTRGWNSCDVVTRALRELEEGGFIHQTVKGMRPNRASWWAITWRDLDAHAHYDPGAAETFRRGAYRQEPLAVIVNLRPPPGSMAA